MTLSLGHADKVQLRKGWVLMLFTSRNILDQEVFSYLVTHEKFIKALEQAIATSEMVDITDYGHLVHQGLGEPSDEDARIAQDAARVLVETL
jgi:hypothetical protein